MKAISLVLLAILIQNCINKRPFDVVTYKDQSYNQVGNITFTVVKDTNTNLEICSSIENILQRKGYLEDSRDFDLAVFFKVYSQKTKLTDVDFLNKGGVLSKKYTSGKSLMIQIMDSRTKEIIYRGTCSGLPSNLSKTQLKAVLQQSLRNLDEVSKNHLSFIK
jgi:hypothetical protein